MAVASISERHFRSDYLRNLKLIYYLDLANVISENRQQHERFTTPMEMWAENVCER